MDAFVLPVQPGGALCRGACAVTASTTSEPSPRRRYHLAETTVPLNPLLQTHLKRLIRCMYLTDISPFVSTLLTAAL